MNFWLLVLCLSGFAVIHATPKVFNLSDPADLQEIDSISKKFEQMHDYNFCVSSLSRLCTDMGFKSGEDCTVDNAIAKHGVKFNQTFASCMTMVREDHRDDQGTAAEIMKKFIKMGTTQPHIDLCFFYCSTRASLKVCSELGMDSRGLACNAFNLQLIDRPKFVEAFEKCLPGPMYTFYITWPPSEDES